jgi:hypothetical protein
MIVFSPAQGNISCGSRNSTGTILTIPANSTWTGDLCISASVAAAGTGAPTITVNGSDVGPAGGTIVHRLSITGLALTTISDSCSIPVLIVTGASSATLDFATGGASSAACVANGALL